MSVRYDCSDPASRRRGLDQAVRALGDGSLVVLPTDTGYAVAGDAFRREIPAAICAAKGRQAPPPPVLVPELRTLDGVATRVPESARRLARAWWPGGVSLVCHAQPTLDWGLGTAVTVRVPLHAVALELLSRTGPLAATGAGSGETVLSCARAQELLGESVAVYLDAGAVPEGAASTVIDAREEPLRILRAGVVAAADLAALAPELAEVAS